MTLDQQSGVGVLGCGTMGVGIAQIAATYGHRVVVFDTSTKAREKASESLRKILDRLVEKGRMDADTADGVFGRIDFVDSLDTVSDCGLVVEAVFEDLGVKQRLFADVEGRVDESCVLATNTSSLSIAAIASACRRPERFVGIHFFNPAPLMPLVEIVPGVRTDPGTATAARGLMDAWGKTTVLAKDTPGFIVNRVARPFYGESLRLLDEGAAGEATIDWAMKTLGGFRMGPFELMDFIGNDVNYTVTETVFREFFFDPRYRPSFTQKRMVEAGLLGRKSGAGFYDYSSQSQTAANEDPGLGEAIVDRVVAMLINEAADALFWRVASRDDIDLAMTKGVNYPKGLLRWADQIGVPEVLARIELLQRDYCEDRYRPSPLLRRMAESGATFY